MDIQGHIIDHWVEKMLDYLAKLPDVRCLSSEEQEKYDESIKAVHSAKDNKPLRRAERQHTRGALLILGSNGIHRDALLPKFIFYHRERVVAEIVMPYLPHS